MDYKYKARTYTQNALEEKIFKDVKIMANTLLPEGRRLVIERTDEKNNDRYPSCKNWEKKYCPAKPTKYVGYIEFFDKDEEGENRWLRRYHIYSDSELGVYLRFIERLLGDRLFYPVI